LLEGKVIRYLLCKLDGREYQIGETYQSTDQSRIDELVDLGYLEKAEVTPKQTKGTSKKRAE
jgi:hypothetical protein